MRAAGLLVCSALMSLSLKLDEGKNLIDGTKLGTRKMLSGRGKGKTAGGNH